MKIILIRPQTEFASAEELLKVSAAPESDLPLLHLTQVLLMPVIVDSDGLPFVVPNLFLRQIALSSNSATGDTVRTYAEALLNWLRFIRAQKLELQEATEERLASYRNYLVNRATADGQRLLSPATVNNRIAVVCRLYAWSQKRGVMQTSLGECLRAKEMESGGQIWHGIGGSRRSNNSFRVGGVQRMPRVLAPEEIARLFAIARQPFKLMFRWNVATGIRRFEVCNLRRSTLMSAAQISAKGMALVPIDVLRKGGKTTTVQAPAALVEETHWYCLTERPLEASPLHGDFVFLNQKGAPFTRSTLSRAFRQYADEIGSKATLHHLRHTFATLVLGVDFR